MTTPIPEQVAGVPVVTRKICSGELALFNGHFPCWTWHGDWQDPLCDPYNVPPQEDIEAAIRDFEEEYTVKPDEILVLFATDPTSGSILGIGVAMYMREDRPEFSERIRSIQAMREEFREVHQRTQKALNSVRSQKLSMDPAELQVALRELQSALVMLGGGVKTGLEWRRWVTRQGGYPFDLENPHVVPGRYQHCKGGTYKVLGTGQHSEREGKRLVVYISEKDGTIWLRPPEMFHDEHSSGKPRFTRLPPIHE
jgi:hypothetical protein